MLPRASSGNAAAGLKYLYSSAKDDIVPRRPTVPIDSLPAHRKPGGAQWMAIPKSEVNPITETTSLLCIYFIWFCLDDDDIWISSLLLFTNCVLKRKIVVWSRFIFFIYNVSVWSSLQLAMRNIEVKLEFYLHVFQSARNSLFIYHRNFLIIYLQWLTIII